MSIAKVIELIAEGDTVETAVEDAVRQATKTVHEIKHVYVEGIQALIDHNQVSRYRVNVKVTFVVEDSE